MPERGVEASKEVLRERLLNEQKRAQDLKAQYYLEVKAAEKQPDLALHEISEQPRAAQIIQELKGLIGNDIPLTRNLTELARWVAKPLDKPENMAGGSIRQLLLELQSGSSESSSEVTTSIEANKSAFQAMILEAFAQGGKLQLTKEEMLSALQEMGLLSGTPVRKDRGPLNALGTPEEQARRNRELNE